MDLSKNNQYDSRSETVEMGRKLHTAALFPFEIKTRELKWGDKNKYSNIICHKIKSI